MTAVPRVVEPELVAHIYAAVDGPGADRARDLIRQMWTRCGERLGMSQPVAPTTTGSSSVLAVRQSPDRSFQAVLRREHDVLNLSVLLSSADDALRAPSTWQRMDRLLDTVIDDGLEDSIGVARLYLAKVAGEDPVEVAPRLGPAIAALLPAIQQEKRWWRRKLTTASGMAVWEISPRDDTRTERRIVVLAPSHGDRELSVWTWSDGTPLMPPFARYLMHHAKIRYELRIHAAATPNDLLCWRVERGIDELRAIVDAGTRQEHRGDRSTLRSDLADQLSDQLSDQLADRLAALRADRANLAERAAGLKAMRRTVEIAAENAFRDAWAVAAKAAMVDADAAMSTGGDLFGDDGALAEWFTQQLDDEIAYLESAFEGAHRLIEIAGEMPDLGVRRVAGELSPARAAVADPSRDPVFGIVTAMPEEFAAMSALVDEPARKNVEGDRANYLLGTLPGRHPNRPHRVVLTMLGDTGNDAAADACANLVRSFGSVGYLLMVGVAAGAPDLRSPQRHVRLGDVVVSTWGIVDYDHVVDTVTGPEPRQPFPRPSRLLTHCANWLAAEEMLDRRPWEAILRMAETRLPDFRRPPAETDLLCASDRADRHQSHPDIGLSGHRPEWPKVHYGYIGSADRALRNAQTRDQLAAKHNLRAFEMEGKGIGNAGFANGLEWLAVRGISDYGDSRTDRRWRKYAALAAAAYTRALLTECPPVAPRGGRPGSVREDDGPR